MAAIVARPAPAFIPGSVSPFVGSSSCAGEPLEPATFPVYPRSELFAAIRLLAQCLSYALVSARMVAFVVLATTVLPTTGGVCCALVSSASEAAATESPDDCCPRDADPEDTQDGTPCPCPFPCTPSCAGSLCRALPHVSALHLAPPPAQLALPLCVDANKPSNPDPRDILHVPIPLGA
jgi:hypothetical protein